MIELLGWIATVIFVMSYFCKRAEVLGRVQMAGAAIWILYGLLMQAAPVVAANSLVMLAAAWTAARPSSPISRESAVDM
jgi:hypothetical protein